MKKYFAVIALIMVFLVILIPFASSNPDGLEKVAATFGVEEHQPLWNGLMADYSIVAIDNSYLSTVLAGVFGTFVVLLVTFLLGRAIAPKSRAVSDKQ
jgi:ABC-type sulfate transport system permease component